MIWVKIYLRGDIMSCRLLKIDPYLEPHKEDIEQRIKNYKNKRISLVKEGSLADFAKGYEYFGFHREKDGWVYREWAPAADKMYITGDFNGWNLYSHELTRLSDGVFEIKGLPLECSQKVQAVVVNGSQVLRRIPSYATRVVQDENTLLWCCELEDTFKEYNWTDDGFTPSKVPFVYECHIGMAQDKYGVGTYVEFEQNVLPRIKKLGYNTIQIMAIAEHPYYGSFGYQVSNFFAPSSRYGTSEELKSLINTAHSMGIAVLLDVVHSHTVKNTAEGICEFDGTDFQYCHTGAKGDHPAWGTRLFDYNKNEVIHFLLSNLQYWQRVFHFDGFRFDGVTSMLYHDHGLGSAFTNYDMYFSLNTDTEAVTYLCLANELVHEVNPNALTIAEDMSGMPGMCIKQAYGGIGFDYRLSMGVPDLWIKMLKETPDEHWNMGKLWYELTTRRPQEKNIGYCESHDQALVGDKTIMFRLCDAEMYTSMAKDSDSVVVDRGVALHKMIRLITAALAGEGYLNFMGNEFGHPEWIDFPREGNGWSYHYCRRQWNLADNELLRYGQLCAFDEAMISLLKSGTLITKPVTLHYIHEADKLLVFSRGNNLFVFNFDPSRSYEGYFIPTPAIGKYRAVLSTDDEAFGGHNRIDKNYRYVTEESNGSFGIKLYIPSRTATVFKKSPR